MGKGNVLEITPPKNPPLLPAVVCTLYSCCAIIESSAGCSRRRRVLRGQRRGVVLTMSGMEYVMSKSSKVSVAVANSVNPVFAANILAKCDSVAGQALDVQIDSAKATDSFRAEFADLCIAAGVPTIKVGTAVQFDRKSEVGQALDKVLRERITEKARKSSHYNIKVHQVGNSDRYQPVAIWSDVRRCFEPVAGMVPNHTFTAAFALGVDLKSLPNVIEAPEGVKAWMRGNAVACRPDGRGQGMRDWIKNDVDQALSRGWRMDQSGKRKGGSRGEFDEALANLYKGTHHKRNRWERDNQDEEVVSDAQWKSLCEVIQTVAFNPALCDAVIAAANEAAN